MLGKEVELKEKLAKLTLKALPRKSWKKERPWNLCSRSRPRHWKLPQRPWRTSRLADRSKSVESSLIHQERYWNL